MSEPFKIAPEPFKVAPPLNIAPLEISGQGGDANNNKIAEAMSKLQSTVAALVDDKKSSGSGGDPSRFTIVPQANPSSTAITTVNHANKRVVLTGAEMAEIGISIAQVKNSAKHLKFVVAERLEQTAKELKELADSEIQNIEGIQRDIGTVLKDASERGE